MAFRGSTSLRERRPALRRRVGDLEFRVVGGETRGAVSELPPVVLVHGIGMSHRSLARLHDAFAAERVAVSLDLPGFGGLPKPGRDLDVRSMGQALGRMIATLQLPPVILVGHSMGAQWVVEASLLDPRLVSHVVLVGPVVDDRHRTLGAQLRALAVDTLGESIAVNVIVLVDYLRCGIAWYLRQLRHMLAYPLEDRIAELGMPVLIVRGTRDPIAGLSWCRRLRDRARMGTLVEVRGPHVVLHTAARSVASAIRRMADPAPAVSEPAPGNAS